MRALTLAGTGAVATAGTVVVGVWMLFERTQRPTLEAKSYVHSIHEAAEGWVSNTERLMEELGRLPAAAAPLPALVEAYATARKRG